MKLTRVISNKEYHVEIYETNEAEYTVILKQNDTYHSITPTTLIIKKFLETNERELLDINSHEAKELLEIVFVD